MTKSNKILLVMIILTICFIWGQSLLPANISKQESQVINDIHGYKVFQKELKENIGTTLDIRKIAHFIEFFILGIELCLLHKTKTTKCWILIFKAISVAGAIALIDETIQAFSTNRSSLVTDVWIDIGGAALGMFICMSLMLLHTKFRSDGEMNK